MPEDEHRTKEDKEQTKMIFPIKGSDVCPDCGSTERVGRQVIDQLKSELRLPANSYPEGLSFGFPLTAAIQSVLGAASNLIPTVQVCVEICGKCHKLYVTMVNLHEIPSPFQRLGKF